MNNNLLKISVIVPAFNEEKIILETLNRLKNRLAEIKSENKISDYEIIVVNDASTDRTEEILKNINGIKIIAHPYQKGYGAALKTGARNARFEYLLFCDGDGQHKPEYLEEFIKHLPEFDLVIGERIGYQGPAVRQPGKKILTWMANYLVGEKIPDINCGFRAVKKDLFLEFSRLLPNSFSASTTLTLAFYKEGFNVKFIPIAIEQRKGKSTVKPKDAITMTLLILRIIMLFNPLKIFMPIGLAIFLLAVFISLDYLFIHKQIFPVSSGIVFLTSLFTFSLGLIADQIATLKRSEK